MINARKYIKLIFKSEETVVHHNSGFLLGLHHLPCFHLFCFSSLFAAWRSLCWSGARSVDRERRWVKCLPNITQRSGAACVSPLSFLPSLPPAPFRVLLCPGWLRHSGEAPSNWSGPAVVAPNLQEPGSCVLMLRSEEIVLHYFLRSNNQAAWLPFVVGIRKLELVY